MSASVPDAAVEPGGLHAGEEALRDRVIERVGDGAPLGRHRVCGMRSPIDDEQAITTVAETASPNPYTKRGEAQYD
jgi:hypothetical protein